MAERPVFQRPALLEHLGKLTLPGTINFVPKEHYVPSTSGKVKIKGMNERFLEEFVAHTQLSWWETRPSCDINIYRSREDAWSAELLVHLDMRELSLPMHWAILERIAEAGENLIPLRAVPHAKDASFVCFVRSWDGKGVVRTIRSWRQDDGWLIYAGQLGNASKINEQTCVVAQ